MHKIVLTVIDPDGDRTLRQFPFDLRVSGSKEAAEERMELAIQQLPAGCGVLWEVVRGRHPQILRPLLLGIE